MSKKPTYTELVTQNKELEKRVVELTETDRMLRANEIRLREAQQLVQLGNWSWDVSSGKVEWSREVYKIFRLDPREFTPQIDSILDLSPWPEDHKRDKELIQKAIDSREVGFYEQRFLRPDGSIGYYISTFKGVYDDNGNLTEINGTVQDITRRKQAEEVLAVKEVFLKTLLNAIPIPVFFKNREGQYQGFNKKFQSFFGRNQEDLIGKSVFDINPPDLAETYHAMDKKLFEGEVEEQTYKSQVKNAKGELRDVIFHKSVFTDNSDDISGLIGVISDITEQKKTEQQKDELILDLKEAIQKVKTLSGLLPICMHCKKIRDDQGYWNQIESYICSHSSAEFSHGICEKCLEKHYPEEE